MRGDYRFMKSRNGILGFAAVSVESEPSTRWDIRWSDEADLQALRHVFGAAVEEGVRLAAVDHEKAGGAPQRVEILALGHNPADTRPDAVRCAAAVAAWKPWGHDDATARFQHEAEWAVTFPVDGHTWSDSVGRTFSQSREADGR